MNTALFLVYLIPVPIWLITAGIAFRYKRAFVSIGMASAGLNSIVAAVLKAGGTVPIALQLASAVASVAIVGLICAGLIGNLPKRPPTQWKT